MMLFHSIALKKFPNVTVFLTKELTIAPAVRFQFLGGKRSEAVIVALKKAAQQILQKFRGKQLWANSVQLS